MKIFVLMAAMLIYFSVAIQDTLKGISYPSPGVQLKEVRIFASAENQATENIALMQTKEVI